jgi:hypothetical protein
VFLIFSPAHPEMIALNFVGPETPGQEDSVAFFTAEAVARIGQAFKAGKIPLQAS